MNEIETEIAVVGEIGMGSETGFNANAKSLVEI